MKKGLILLNAYASMKAVSGQAARLQQELAQRGVTTHILRNGQLPVEITAAGEIRAQTQADFVIYLDKDPYTSLMLEKAGLRLFNRHEAIQICDDKLATFIRLAGAGIPMPRTLPAPLCYYPGTPVDPAFLDRIADTLGYPLVVKECLGSLGAQVYRADDREGLEHIVGTVDNRRHLYQQYVAHSAGRDIRVIVIGGRAVAAMRRVSDTDFRSNIELGGRGEPIDLPAEVAALAEKAATLLELDYAGVDVLFGPDGYLLCEVNSNAFFEGIEAVTGHNVAGDYADHIVRCIGC